MSNGGRTYLNKAEQSLAGAESEFANGRYGNYANRSYYACFQAGVHALRTAGIATAGTRSTWSHERLQAEFVTQLISRRKLYPAELRDALPRAMALRIAADYTEDHISELQAARALRRARLFVSAVQEKEGQA